MRTGAMGVILAIVVSIGAIFGGIGVIPAMVVGVAGGVFPALRASRRTIALALRGL